MTQAPPSLVKLTTAYKARPDRANSYVMDGIVGDAAHMNPPSGYHVSWRDLGERTGIYSVTTPRDIAGAKKYPDYASAWDLGLGPADMITLTTRLVNAAKANDPRLGAVAEFAGTTNGSTVHAFYVNTGTDDPHNTGGWDSGHTTHIHLSISRDDCDNYPALAPILDVLCGVPLVTDPLEEIMAFYASKAEFEADMEALVEKAVAKFLHDPANKQYSVYTIVQEALTAAGFPPKK